MTKVGSFLYLLHSCRERESYLSPTPPIATPPKHPASDGFYLLEAEDIVSVEVPFHLSSLFTSSRIVSFELDVFSEGTADLKQINVQLRNH